MTDAQQTYHAAPEHPLWDILENIVPHGLAIPGDGDKIARHTRTHNDHLAREYHGASRAEWARMDVELRRTIVNVYRGRLRDGRMVMKGPNE